MDAFEQSIFGMIAELESLETEQVSNEGDDVANNDSAKVALALHERINAVVCDCAHVSNDILTWS